MTGSVLLTIALLVCVLGNLATLRELRQLCLRLVWLEISRRIDGAEPPRRRPPAIPMTLASPPLPPFGRSQTGRTSPHPCTGRGRSLRLPVDLTVAGRLRQSAPAFRGAGA